MADQTPQIDDEAVRSVQEHEMPEGAPPPASESRRWGVIVAVCAVVMAAACLAVVFIIDGATAVLFGGAMLLAYICLGGMVAIVASIERAKVRRQIEERLRKESSAS